MGLLIFLGVFDILGDGGRVCNGKIVVIFGKNRFGRVAKELSLRVFPGV
jgi:hypothetical protein